MLPFLTTLALFIPLATLILTLIATRRFPSRYKRVMTVTGGTLAACLAATAIFVFGVLAHFAGTQAESGDEPDVRAQLVEIASTPPFIPGATRFVDGGEKATFEARYVWFTLLDTRSPAELKPLLARRWFSRSESVWHKSGKPPELFGRQLAPGIPNSGIWFVMFDRSRSVHIALRPDGGSVVTVISSRPF